jgi:hypothetical protein
MKQYAIAGLLLASLTVPALATNLGMRDATDTAPNYSYAAKDHWAVDDTVGNCAVIDSKPSPYNISGLKILGDKSGYPSLSAAEKEIKSDSSACKGVVSRA